MKTKQNGMMMRYVTLRNENENCTSKNISTYSNIFVTFVRFVISRKLRRGLFDFRYMKNISTHSNIFVTFVRFVISRTFRRGLFDIRDVQHCIQAAGVAMGYY